MPKLWAALAVAAARVSGRCKCAQQQPRHFGLPYNHDLPARPLPTMHRQQPLPYAQARSSG